MSPQYCDSMFSETLGIFNALEVREVIIPQTEKFVNPVAKGASLHGCSFVNGC